MPEHIKHNFSFLFDSNIWNILFDTNLPLIAIELRDYKTKTVRFKLIDLVEGKLSESLTFYPNWLSASVALTNGFLVTQYYKEAGFPEPKGWSCFHVFSQKKEIEELSGSFNFITNDQLVSSRVFFEEIIIEAYTFATGEKRKLLKDEVEQLKPVKIKLEEPQQYLEDNSHFSTIREFVKTRGGKDAVLGAEYLEFNSKIILSYYIRISERLENFLMITDSKGEVLIDKSIDTEVEGIRKHTFFVKENQLLFITGKNHIHSYVL